MLNTVHRKQLINPYLFKNQTIDSLYFVFRQGDVIF